MVEYEVRGDRDRARRIYNRCVVPRSGCQGRPAEALLKTCPAPH
jgi:hypothetical protein